MRYTAALVVLMMLSAQDVPDSSLRIFSHGIVPVETPEPGAGVRAPVPPPASFIKPPVLPPHLESGDLPPIGREILSLPPLEPPKSWINREAAETAWRYFEKNYHPASGWFDSVKGYPFTTMWDLSSGLAAVACAEQLGLISRQKAGEMLARSLETLAKAPLYNGELPNREYNTATGKISAPKETAGRGTGWSAIDIGRLLIWLKITAGWHPELSAQARGIVQRWKFARLAQNGEMFGVYYGGKREYHRQEGRLGYEQYSARGYELWGISMLRARLLGRTAPTQVEGVDLAADTRNLPYLTSDPFLFAAFEAGSIGEKYGQLTDRVYRAQQRRWSATHELTAVTEDSLDRAPWFVYFNISYQGRAWICLDHSGKPAAGLCGFSAKAALGWASLYEDEYASLLEESALKLASPGGYIAGRYPNGKPNTALNINTNAAILEALLFRERSRRAFLEPTTP